MGELGKGEGVIGSYFDDGVAVAVGGGAFDQSGLGVIMDTVHKGMSAFMVMGLKDSQNGWSLLQYGAGLGRVFD